jgi:hypothetical protein
VPDEEVTTESGTLEENFRRVAAYNWQLVETNTSPTSFGGKEAGRSKKAHWTFAITPSESVRYPNSPYLAASLEVVRIVGEASSSRYTVSVV